MSILIDRYQNAETAHAKIVNFATASPESVDGRERDWLGNFSIKPYMQIFLLAWIDIFNEQSEYVPNLIRLRINNNNLRISSILKHYNSITLHSK